MTPDPVPLTPERLPPPVVERLRLALAMPMAPGPDCTCGIFRADGSFRPLSRTLLSGARLSGVPEPDEMPVAEAITGRWLFAGIGRHHFGHFLVETLIRLWAVRAYREELDGIVIIPKHGMDFSLALARRYGSFLALLSDDLPVHIAEFPTRYETLLLPSPGFGPLGWIEGSEVFRREMRARVAGAIRPAGSDKLYISRSGLKQSEKRVHDEDRIEALLARAGYDIFHPEAHSIEDQLARYMAATTVIGGDGSAFHLAAFALPRGARVGLIQRRHRPKVLEAFKVQLEAFNAAEVHLVRPVLPRTAATPHPSEAATPIDFEVVAAGLADAGLI